MTPDQLTAASFSSYPPQARQFAAAHLPLLRQLPVAVAPAFLREIIVYDWRFPAERRNFDRQCAWLESLPSEQRVALIAPFQQVTVPASLASKDWVAAPQPFLEALTAYLWTSNQIDAYRRSAQNLLAVPADETARKKDRCVLVIVGKDATAPSPQLFRKLAPHGVTLRNLQWTPKTPQQLHEMLHRRAAETTAAYTRWYIDGGEPWPHDPAAFDLLSYTQLRPVREIVLERMNRFTHSGPGGPEEMRLMLDDLKPAESGAGSVTNDPLLQHFITALFADGSGTQIYSTSFVQWAARETLRRAQPEQMLVRFAPRQRQRTLNQLFAAATNVEVPDPEGSLRDGDISAYYIWLDLLRMSDPAHITFLAWRENEGHAVLITPHAPAGQSDATPLDLYAALAKYA